MTIPFNPAAVADRDIARRLKISSDAALPSGWAAGHFPRPALPIDECVRELLRKRRIRESADLRAIHRLGVCPYALARYGVVRAALHAGVEQEKQDNVSLPQGKPLLEAMSRSRRLLETGSQAIASLHRDLSKHRGNVWRLSFVTALFAEWWVLTAKDPKASPGPCHDFICAAWCSLSPVAAPTDADWASAIKVAKSRCKPGEWRTG